MGPEQAEVTGAVDRQVLSRDGSPTEERPYWIAVRELAQAAEHLDLTAANLIDRLQPFSGGSAPPTEPGVDAAVAPAPAVATLEGVTAILRRLDGRLETLTHYELHI